MTASPVPATNPPAAAELRLVRLPLRRPHVAAHGTETERRVVLVRLLAHDGIAGWGECSALSEPGYSSEHTAGAWDELRHALVPALLAGAPVPRGGSMARAALATAAAVVRAERAGCSLATALASLGTGSSPATEVASTAVVAVDGDLDALLVEVEAALAAGHRHVKLKIRPGWDIEPLTAVRGTWPDLWLAVDANGSYQRDAAALAELSRFELAYIEQPLAPGDLDGHAALLQRGVTVALDEAVTSAEAVRKIARLGAAHAVNLKPARLGGPEGAMRALQASVEAGLRSWCGGMLETGIGRAPALAFAAQPGHALPTDLGPTNRYFDDDVAEPPFTLAAGGTLAVPASAGLGVRVRPGRLDEVTVERWTAGDLS